MSMLSTMGWTASIVIIAGILLYIFLKVKKSLDKQKVPDRPKEEGDDQTNKELATTNTNHIKVVIWRALSEGLVAQVGQPIMCVEKPDANNNLTVMNEEKRFKEDFNFNKDRIFEMLEFSLQTQNKSKAEKAVLLNKAIKKQEEIVNILGTDLQKNKDKNAPDEKLKLRQLKVLRSSLQMETTGNYMRLGGGGIRQYEFVSIDGILYPYFFGSKWYRVYPDLLVKKKIFNQENTIFRNEIAGTQKNVMNWMMIVVLAIGALMSGGGAWMMTHAYAQNSEVTLIANQGALSCANTLAKINDNYGTIIKDYQNLKQKQSESIKSIETPKITIGGINIDPTKITN